MGDGRLVHLAVVTPAGRVLGVLPPLRVQLDWENDTLRLVAGVREAYGIDVTVLRMRWVEGFEEGGPVGYLVESADLADGLPAGLGPLEPGEPEQDHPLRVPWARPGGPAATLAWADRVLAERGRPRTGPAEQRRTWGLSGIWKLPTASGAVWCKQVPAYFRHEGPVIGWLERAAPGLGPELLGAERDRLMTVDIPDAEQWEPDPEVRRESLARLLGVQSAAAGKVEELLGLGVPDRRAEPLSRRIRATAAAWAGELDPGERSALEALLGSLPGRLAAIAECGVPDTLVHGDFHPGNVLVHEGRGTIIDWTDAQIAHPALDLAPFLVGLPEPERAVLRAQWAAHWRAAVPGCEPERAADLFGPLSALAQATAYDMFIRESEPDERIWHAKYVVRWLRRALTPDWSLSPRAPSAS
jgi:phosphotransferase family enzyme